MRVCRAGCLPREELFEAWTWRQLGYHDEPIGLLNVGGYYDPLLQFMQRTVDEGFLSPVQISMIDVDDDASRLLDTLAAKLGPRGNEDLSKI